MPTGLIVLSRMDSRRLPGKALRPLGGRPLMVRVIERLRAMPGEFPIVVATSDRTADDPIAAAAEAEGATVFRGDAGDVAGRCLAAARAHGFDRFSRVCGDSPFIDPLVMAEAIALHKIGSYDVVTTVQERTWPNGSSVEIVGTDAMARLTAATDDQQDREHVTRYFYRCPDAFRILNLLAPDPSYAGVHLAVDTPDDLARAEWIYERLGEPKSAAILEETVALAREYEAAQAGAEG